MAVSTKDQFLDRQITALTEAGCIRIVACRKSGKNVEREELWKALDYLREGDTLVVPSLDRLGRSLCVQRRERLGGLSHEYAQVA